MSPITYMLNVGFDVTVCLVGILIAANVGGGWSKKDRKFALFFSLMGLAMLLLDVYTQINPRGP